MAKRIEQWQLVDAAARRLDRHPGHLRRLCSELERQGLARRLHGGGKRWRWQVSRRFNGKPSAARPAGSLPAQFIDIDLPGGVRIRVTYPAAGSGRDEVHRPARAGGGTGAGTGGPQRPVGAQPLERASKPVRSGAKR